MIKKFESMSLQAVVTMQTQDRIPATEGGQKINPQKQYKVLPLKGK
jgi:hypothetical protein